MSVAFFVRQSPLSEKMWIGSGARMNMRIGTEMINYSKEAAFLHSAVDADLEQMNLSACISRVYQSSNKF